MSELQLGHVYVIRSRNLDRGVWEGSGFIGLRLKFNSLYLDTEYLGHTAHDPVPTGDVLPEGIELVEGHSRDSRTGRPTDFDKPIASGGRGWFFTDTGEASTDIRAAFYRNEPLYDFLFSLYPEERQRELRAIIKEGGEA